MTKKPVVLGIYFIFVLMNKLRNKVKALFSYRALPELIDIAGANPEERNALLEMLYELQEAIYHLDEVLETELEINQKELDLKWKDIHQCLIRLGCEPSELDKYCRQIYRYQKHELSQRKGKSVARFDMEYFYFFKSCDVKLMRRLIYERYAHLEKMYPLSEWRCFDLYTELNDDIEDVYEDYGTINGNRFLVEIEKNGISQAFESFNGFLKNTKIKYKDKIEKYPVDNLLRSLTESAFSNTKVLLNQRKEAILLKPLTRGDSVENSESN